VRREISLAVLHPADVHLGLIPPLGAVPLIAAAHKLVYGQPAPRQPHARALVATRCRRPPTKTSEFQATTDAPGKDRVR